MSVSRAYLERCATETHFDVSALEKVVRLGKVAEEIGRHALLGRSLALKGGTALNLAFGKPNRLSVDLDFNYVGAVEREEMLRERPSVERAVADMARKLGYRVQHSSDLFAGRKVFLHYRSVVGPESRIEVDLNFHQRMPLAPIERRELWQPGDLDRPVLACVAVDELLIGKLCALLDRGAVRDAWDVGHLAPELAAAPEQAAFRGRFVALAGTLDHSPASYRRERLAERLTQSAIESELVPLLARGVSIPAEELLSRAWSRVAPLLALTDSERQFIARLEAGEVRAELLFPDEPNESRRLSAHPALLWKARNAAMHRERSGASRIPRDDEPSGF